MNEIINANCIEYLKKIETESVHLILSDIPYGISYEDWDVIHSNTNSALLGTSPAQQKAGKVFKKRGKPLNGWSEADKKIPLEYYEWCKKWAGEWFRVVKPGASVFIFAGRRLAHRCISAMEDCGFTYKDMICWQKEVAPHRAQRISAVYDRRGDDKNSTKWKGWRVGNLRPIFEPILWFVKPYKIGGTLADNVLQHGVGAYNDLAWSKYVESANNMIKIKSNKKDRGLHPTQKPIMLMEALIELTTIEGQIVLDPFCGSGSTLVAAKRLGRNYIGIEQDENFCEIARERLESTIKNEK